MTTDLKHTPGPWLDWSTMKWLRDPQKLLTNTEDARLIAAAPELLEALQDTMEALAMCQPRTDHGARCQSDAMLKARAAIAKALSHEASKPAVVKCECGKPADTKYDGDDMCRACATYCASRDFEEGDMPGGFGEA